MKILFTLLFLAAGHLCAQSNLTFHSFKVKDIQGDTLHLSTFQGKKLLVVNTASFCGYTYQFKKLQKLDSAYQPYNFRVVGFPCNDFGGQDPFADSTIETFCQNQYAVTFPMMSKISIRVGDTSMVYKWLQKKSLNGVSNATVAWNFNKFLINGQGKWVRHFVSTVEPYDTAITNWIGAGVVTGADDNKARISDNLLFQNPVQHRLYMDNLDESSEAARISIIDLNGKRLKVWNYPQGIAHVEESVEGIQRGIYLLEVQIGPSVERFRVLVEN